jgi:hypothetical protein
MQPLPRNLTDKFAVAFAGEKRGFSARQISDYFVAYSNLVKPYDHYGVNPTRHQLFIECVYALSPKHQYYALNDLAYCVHDSKYTYPSEDERRELITQLHNFISTDPIGLSFSTIRETAFREDWVTCQSRLKENPPAAITAARTMIETLLKTIIHERGGSPETSGDLGRLLKQAEDVLGFDRKARQAEHQIISGLASVVAGIACISNEGGDRHGLIAGQEIDDPALASLVVNAAGTIGMAFVDMHLLTPTN